MKCKAGLLFIALLWLFSNAQAQADSTAIKKPPQNNHAHQDSMIQARLNHSGNLMIAGGVGLCAVGGYLLYQGVKIYNAPIAPKSQDPASDKNRNQRQGTAYLAAGGIAILGGVVLTALGVRNKIEFKQRKRMMSLRSGLLDNGNLGAMLTF